MAVITLEGSIKKHAEQNSRIGSVAKRHSSVIFRHVYKCKSVRGLMHSPELAQFYYDTKDELRNFSKNSFAFSRDFQNYSAICDLRGVNSDLVCIILFLSAGWAIDKTRLERVSAKTTEHSLHYKIKGTHEFAFQPRDFVCSEW